MNIKIAKNDFINFEQFLFSLELYSKPIDFLVHIEETNEIFYYVPELYQGRYRYITS